MSRSRSTRGPKRTPRALGTRRRGRKPPWVRLNGVSTVWGLIAVACFCAAWIAVQLLQSLTVILTAVGGGVGSTVLAVVAARSPRVAAGIEAARRLPAKEHRRASEDANPSARPARKPTKRRPTRAGKPRRRPKCSARCRKSIQPVSRCRCSCGGRTHGIDNPASKYHQPSNTRENIGEVGEHFGPWRRFE